MAVETEKTDGPRLACAREREELVQCLLKTDCVIKSGKTPTECLRNSSELPIKCQHLLSSYADCKRGMLDMRRRFRGNHLTDEAKRGVPAHAPKELHAEQQQ